MDRTRENRLISNLPGRGDYYDKTIPLRSGGILVRIVSRLLNWLCKFLKVLSEHRLGMDKFF